MSTICNHCINKAQCSECDKSRKEKFVPSEEVKHYFERYYVGVYGIDGRVYSWNSTNPNLIPTTDIDVDGYGHYCPYCGEKMFPIQGYLARGIDDYSTTGYCCICQGARDELEYKRKRIELEQKHAKELRNLEDQYRGKLTYCTDKLIEMRLSKIKKELASNPRTYSYFATLNGEKYNSVEQFIKL